MAKTHSEQWYVELYAECPHQLDADASLLGTSRSGGKHDPAWRQTDDVAHADLVALYDHEIRSEAAQGVN
jgi:hypothetical protein